MAKFDPKKADLNKDGKLSDYEENVGKKRAAAMKMGHSPKKMKHSPMKKYGNGYAMKMGSKEINSPSAFSMKDAANMADSPMMNHHEIKLDGVTVEGKASDPLKTQKEYKKALQDLGKNVTAQVKRQYSRDSMMSNIGSGSQRGKFGKLDIPGKSVGYGKGSDYGIGLAHDESGTAVGRSPRMYAYDKAKRGALEIYGGTGSGYTELSDKGELTRLSAGVKIPGLKKELSKYQKLSDSLFAQGKKRIDLKFFGNKK